MTNITLTEELYKVNEVKTSKARNLHGDPELFTNVQSHALTMKTTPSKTEHAFRQQGNLLFHIDNILKGAS